MTIQSYRDLRVWQKAMELVDRLYEVTEAFPSCERFGLTSQLRRAGVSVPSNIAEGHARSHRKEYLQHLSVAIGSLAEIETQLMIAQRRRYIDEQRCERVLHACGELGRMTRALQQSLQQDQATAQTPPRRRQD